MSVYSTGVELILLTTKYSDKESWLLKFGSIRNSCNLKYIFMSILPSGGFVQAAKIHVVNEDPRPKMPPGFQGPSAGPPGLGLSNQPPLSGPPGSAQGAPAPLLVPPKKPAAPKNSFEKIMVNLSKMFPNYKR
jgi:hypothetical protein